MSKLAIHPTQSATQPGFVPAVADGVLTGLEGRLTKITADGVALPAAVTDLAFLLLLEGGADEADVTVQPLIVDSNVRVRANGTGSKGDVLVLCDPTVSSGANAGKVEALDAQDAGHYFSPGIAEEDFVDEQLVKVRPLPRLVFQPAAFTGATPADTAATSSTPFGFAEAQANALLANVREIRAALISSGIMAPNA